MKVNLQYFKESGKYYSEGSYEVDDAMPLFEIFNEVKELVRAKELPGLVKGHSAFYVYIDVPDHPNNYPGLIPINN